MTSKNPFAWLAKKALRKVGSSACYSLERLLNKIPVSEEEEDEPYPSEDFSEYDAGEPIDDYWQESYEDDELEDDPPLPDVEDWVGNRPRDWEWYDAPPEEEQQEPEEDPEEDEEPEEESESIGSRLERTLTRKFDNAIDSLFWRGVRYVTSTDFESEPDLRSNKEKDDDLWNKELERHKRYKERQLRTNETYKLEKHNEHLFPYPTGEEKDDF